MQHVHLHVHTKSSLLDGVATVKELVKRAKEYDSPAIAVTEHGNLMSEYELYAATKEFDIQPIMGIETYIINPHNFVRKASKDTFDKNALMLEPNYQILTSAFDQFQYTRQHHHLLLLAANQKGIENVRKLTTFSHRNGFYYRPAITHEVLGRHTDGIFSTTGCMAGEVPSLLSLGMDKEAEEMFVYYMNIFKGRYFVEFQRHDIPALEELNLKLLKLAEKYQVPTLATSDIHYLNPEDKKIQELLLRIATTSNSSSAKKVTSGEDDMGFQIGGTGYYYKSPDEMMETFAIYGDEGKRMIENSVALAKDVKYKTTIYPTFQLPSVNKKVTSENKLIRFKESIYAGAKKRYGDVLSQVVIDRIEYETRIIAEMGFIDYFDILSDLVVFIESNNEIWTVRGSGSGSIVLYCLFISHVDPIHHNLIFERFLNPSRISLPDVDVDVSDEFRPKIAKYFQKKYGSNHVAKILTHGTMKLKLALRDVCRLYGITPENINMISKQVQEQFVTVDELEGDANFMKLFQTFKGYKEILESVRYVANRTRQVGVHPAGIIISPLPIESYTAFHRDTKVVGESTDDEIIDAEEVELDEGEDRVEATGAILPVQLDMANTEAAKLVKFDLLGVRTLRIIAETLKLIKSRYSKTMHFTDIPTEYNESYQVYQKGDTVGIFQISSDQMRNIMMRLKPTSIFHIVATVALYRPGPLQFIDDYINRKLGKDTFEYAHEKLEPILKETFGIFIYQEQVMQAVVDLAGFSKAEADTVRKAMSKKDVAKMAKYRDQFIAGAKQVSNMNEKESAVLWDTGIVPFAGYGFNKAHASSYAEISARTAWLKHNYRKEFIVSCLNSEISKAEKVSLYIGDARKSGIKVLPPNINISDSRFLIDDAANAFRFGLRALKHTKKDTLDLIMNERKEHGDYKSIEDLFTRVPKIDKKTVGVLLLSGTLDCLYQGDAKGIAVREKIYESLPESYKKSILKLFEHGITNGIVPTNKFEWLISELITTGDVYLTKHPINVYLELHPDIKDNSDFMFADFLDLRMPVKTERFTLGIIPKVPYYDPIKQRLFADLHGMNGLAIKLAAFGSESDKLSKQLNEDNVLVKVRVYKTERGYSIKHLSVLGKISDTMTYF